MKSALFSSDLSAVCVFQSISLSSHSTRNPTNRPPTVHNTFHSCSPPPLDVVHVRMFRFIHAKWMLDTPQVRETIHAKGENRHTTPIHPTKGSSASTAAPIHTYKFALLRRVCCFSSSLHTLGTIWRLLWRSRGTRSKVGQSFAQSRASDRGSGSGSFRWRSLRGATNRPMKNV